jgi:parallel beta-helix repeat protein
MLFLLVTCVVAFEARTARASGTVYINPDGSITPTTAPISTLDNITYTLTADSNMSIVVNRSNIVVDGAGHGVQGSGSGDGVDIVSENNVTVNNVTLENTSITGFSCGVFLYTSSNDTLSNDRLTGNSEYGVYVQASSNDTLTSNNVNGNYEGIVLDSSSNNTLHANNVAGNLVLGILLTSSSNNTLSGNNVTLSSALGGTGIGLYSSQDNTLYANNVTESYYGITLDSSSGNVLSQNAVSSSFWSNFAVYGSTLNDYINWVDASNLADGKPIVYIVNQNGLVIDSSTNPSVGYLALANCTDITVENLTLANKNREDLVLAYSTNCTITQNNLIIRDHGIYLYSSSDNTVSENNVTAAQPQYSENGIYLISSLNNTVSRNNVSQNGGGIHLDASSSNTVSDNRILENQGGIGLMGGRDNVLSDNFVSGSASWGMWLLGTAGSLVSGNTVTQNNFDGIILSSSAYDDTVSGNNVTGNLGNGITFFLGCFNETVEGNNASENTGDAIQIDSSSNITVSDNNVTGNSDSGIAFYAADSTPYGNTVYGNTVVGNGKGILLNSSVNNTFYHNDFISNTQQAVISGSEPNTWDDGYPSGGNYWSDYNGTDAHNGPSHIVGSDGVGDTPYVIDANNTDNYPLMKPYPWLQHDIGVAYIGEVWPPRVSPLKTVIGLGYTLNVSVFIMNYGSYSEVFNAIVSANATVIGRATSVTVTSDSSIILNFTWSTSGLAYGNYMIKAYTPPVPGETDTTDNTRTSSIYVGIPGDANGDGIVNILDAITLGKAFTTTPGSKNWNPNADINGDGIINILDAIILGNHFLQHYP